jgi:hypothetical protein
MRHRFVWFWGRRMITLTRRRLNVSSARLTRFHRQPIAWVCDSRARRSGTVREKGAEITSDATVPGSIQVPGQGLPIVLLADAQTAGGYPKIATVISADLPRLAVMAPGQRLRFAAISVAAAELAARAREAALRALIADIGPLAEAGGVDLRAIYVANLVSGVVDARAVDGAAAPDGFSLREE